MKDPIDQGRENLAAKERPPREHKNKTMKTVIAAIAELRERRDHINAAIMSLERVVIVHAPEPIQTPGLHEKRQLSIPNVLAKKKKSPHPGLTPSPSPIGSERVDRTLPVRRGEGGKPRRGRESSITPELMAKVAQLPQPFGTPELMAVLGVEVKRAGNILTNWKAAGKVKTGGWGKYERMALFGGGGVKADRPAKAVSETTARGHALLAEIKADIAAKKPITVPRDL